MEYSDMVVVGRVLSVTPYSDKHQFVSAEIAVEQRFKGEAPRRVSVTTAADSGACGYEALLTEERHVLGIDTDDRGNTVNLCSSWSITAPRQGSLVDELMKISTPRPPVDDGPDVGVLAAYIGGSVGALAILVNGAYLSRRRT
jgi:hypothetical protein